MFCCAITVVLAVLGPRGWALLRRLRGTDTRPGPHREPAEVVASSHLVVSRSPVRPGAGARSLADVR